MKSTNEELDSMIQDSDALDQSVALNRIVLRLLEDKIDNFKRLRALLFISLLINLIVVCVSIWNYRSLVDSYNSILENLEWEQTTTTTTEVAQDSEGPGNNLLQIGDNTHMSYGESEVQSDAETNDQNHPDNYNQG